MSLTRQKNTLAACDDILFTKLAKYYDELYVVAFHRDYERDVEFLKRTFRTHVSKAGKILDIACGTGTHACALGKEGFHVVGIDQSQKMLAVAQQKCADARVNVDLIVADMRKFSFKRSFDAAVCMFSSINNNLTVSDIGSLLDCVRDSLKPNGLFIFESFCIPERQSNSREVSTIRSWAAHQRGRKEMWIIEKNQIDATKQVIASENVYFITEDGGIFRKYESRNLRLRLLPPKVVKTLLHSNNFHLIRLVDRETFKTASAGTTGYFAISRVK